MVTSPKAAAFMKQYMGHDVEAKPELNLTRAAAPGTFSPVSHCEFSVKLSY